MINIDNIQMKKCKIAYETDHISISDDTKPKVSLALTFSPFQIVPMLLDRFNCPRKIDYHTIYMQMLYWA